MTQFTVEITVINHNTRQRNRITDYGVIADNATHALMNTVAQVPNADMMMNDRITEQDRITDAEYTELHRKYTSRP